MRKAKVNKAFLIVMGFFIFIFLIFSLSKTAYSNNSELAAINKKIAELEDMRKGYEARAIKHANTADRLQFQEGQLQVAKKHWKLADEYKKIAEKIKIQIDELKDKKSRLQSNNIKIIENKSPA